MEKAARLDPENQNFIDALGHYYKGKKQYQKAEKYYKKSLAARIQKRGDRHPDVARAYGYLGDLYLSQNLYQEAADAFQNSIKALSRTFSPVSVHENPELEDISAKQSLLGFLPKKGKAQSLLFTKSGQSIDLLQALNTYRLADALVDSIRSSYKSGSATTKLIESFYSLV